MGKRGLALLLTLAMIISMFPINAFATEFSDMPDNWSTRALENAVANGLLKGDNGKIMPTDNLTRAQMATIVNRAFGTTEKSSIDNFIDVKSDAWYYDEMSKAVQMKTFIGSGDKLYPDSNITREEAFVVLARAFKISGADEHALDKFTDKNNVSDWARDGVSSLVEEGYIAGSNGRINPKQNITRAEFAQMMDNLLKNYISKEGTYTEDYSGNLMINVPNVTLKGLTITGDLIIGDGVGDGEVTLDAVTVTGRVLVRGGGENSIKITGNSNIQNITIARVDGIVRVYAEDGTEIGEVIADGNDDVIIEGNFGTVTIVSTDITVIAQNANVESASIKGENANIIIDENSSVKTINVNANNVKISGDGTVENVIANANNVAVNTPNTSVTAAEGTEGVTAGDKPVESGETVIVPKEDTSISPGDGSKDTSPSKVEVSAISVEGKDKATIITAKNGTLQMVATVSPENASNKSVTWDFDDNDIDTGSASIDTDTGLLTAKGDGTVTVRATAKDGSGVVGKAVITISNQAVVADKEITSVETLADINVANGTVIGDVSLPATVQATLDDSSTENLAVTWNDGTPVYDGDTAGEYVFEGTLTLVEGIANTANKTATVNVIVAEQERTAIPTITTAAQTVNTATITIEGTAEANAAIIITGGTEVATGTADENRNFSIEVTLTADTVNNLSVTAQVAGKAMSEAATVAITHETAVEASIASVAATNGTVTITLAAKPTVAPVKGDFTATVAIDEGDAEALTLGSFNYDGDKTVTYTFTPIDQTAETQSVVVAVKLGEGTPVAAPAFTVAADQDKAAVATAKAAINGATYTDLKVADLDDQGAKTAAVQTVVTAAVNDETINAVVTWNSETSAYDVAISKGAASDNTGITTASFVLTQEAIDARLAITGVSIADNKAYASTAADGGTVRVLGYGVGINLDAKTEGKKISDTTSIVIELYKGETLLGQQTFSEAGYTKHADKSATSGTIDAGGQYVATSWDHEWTGKIADIPDKAVATVQYTDGTATAEMTLSFTDEQTKIFFAAEAVHVLFEDVFADAESLALKEGVTQDAINAASALVEAVTVKTDQNKVVLGELITQAQALLNAEGKVINTTQNKGYDSIQAAIAEANDNDTIEVSTGVFADKLTINNSLTILGVNADKDARTLNFTEDGTIVTGGIEITAGDVTIKGLTIKTKGILASNISGLTVENNRIEEIREAMEGSPAESIIGLDVKTQATGPIVINQNKFSGIGKTDGTGTAIRMVKAEDSIAITDNIIENVTKNGINLYTNCLANESAKLTVTGNEIKDWDSDTDNNDIGGRAIRIDFIGASESATADITENKLIPPTYPEGQTPIDSEYVKLTAVGINVDLTNNYWGSALPAFGTILKVEGTEAAECAYLPYYTDADMTTLVVPEVAFTFSGLDDVTAGTVDFTITTKVTNNGAITDNIPLRYKAVMTKDGSALENQAIKYPEAEDTLEDSNTWHSFTTDDNGVAYFGPSGGFTLTQLPALLSAEGVTTPFQANFAAGSYSVTVSLLDISDSGEVVLGSGTKTFAVTGSES